MADQHTKVPSIQRFHVVLTPGFAGFDALGQLEYYCGITPLFQTGLSGNQVLHYFDNFPTAAVVTRATRLRSYLAKRIARGEIASRDEVTLVGHSTGGLDMSSSRAPSPTCATPATGSAARSRPGCS